MNLGIPANSGSNELISLDDDDKAVCLTSIVKTIDALRLVHELVSKDTCTVGVRHNTLYVSRSYIKKVEEVLGAEDDKKQEEEILTNSLREVNNENRRLRQEMGNGVTVEAIGNKLYSLSQTVYNWWQNLGFGYSTSKIQPYSHASFLEVEFSANLDDMVGTFEDKPVTAKRKLAAKKARLVSELEFANEDNSKVVVDNQHNRQWFLDKFKERFPGCKVEEFTSRHDHRSDSFFIRKIHVRINIVDIGDVYEKNEKYDE